MSTFVEQAADAVEDDVHLLRRGPAAQSKNGVEPEFVAGRKDLESHVCDLPVGNADHGSVESSHSGRTEAYILDRSLSVARLYTVSHAHSLVKDKRDAADYVF